MNRHFQFKSVRPFRILDFYWFFFQGLQTGTRTALFFAILFAAGNVFADPASPSAAAPPLPDAGGSLIRVIGALALVLGLFLGGAWLFKNWQRLAIQRGRQPKLNILETRSLGARQAVFVVAYERQRFLVATSTAGVNLLSHLPDAEAGEIESAEKPAGPMSFGQALAQVLKKK
ncbi:MAG TPA: flagellar biosynthetic protein FliO [Verrucomicrobiae bacterium]|jgi:flagellar biogenesis protein FliO|nr:flagellar biosynthetic protein FliO [Verrucomicrobiae bacterium]